MKIVMSPELHCVRSANFASCSSVHSAPPQGPALPAGLRKGRSPLSRCGPPHCGGRRLASGRRGSAPRATSRRGDRGHRTEVASSGGGAGRVAVGAPDSLVRGRCGFSGLRAGRRTERVRGTLPSASRPPQTSVQRGDRVLANDTRLLGATRRIMRQKALRLATTSGRGGPSRAVGEATVPASRRMLPFGKIAAVSVRPRMPPELASTRKAPAGTSTWS